MRLVLICSTAGSRCSSSSSLLLGSNGPGSEQASGPKGQASPSSHFQQKGPGPPQWHCRTRWWGNPRKGRVVRAGKEAVVSHGNPCCYLQGEAGRVECKGQVQKKEESVFRTCRCDLIELVCSPALLVLGSFLPPSSLPVIQGKSCTWPKCTEDAG